MLPTWPERLAEQFHERAPDGTDGSLSSRTCTARVPAGLQCSLCGEQLQHVNGTGPVAGPVGSQHGRGLVSEDGRQTEASSLAERTGGGMSDVEINLREHLQVSSVQEGHYLSIYLSTGIYINGKGLHSEIRQATHAQKGECRRGRRYIVLHLPLVALLQGPHEVGPGNEQRLM